MKHFINDEQRAIAYAAFKELERMLKADGDIKPDSTYDVSGSEITITIQPGVTINREAGLKGDGTIEKRAQQNLNGYSILAELYRIASTFNQHKRFERLLKRVVGRAVRRGNTTKDAFAALCPRRAEELENYIAEIANSLPKRTEQTPRSVIRDKAKLFPTIVIKSRKRKAA